jgi:predicted ABC-type transport system involved in lysophospholipase L1 biosynthesis ATPase subunit
VAKKLKQLHLSNNNSTLHKRQMHILKQINLKIREGNALITKANKGKTTVIIYTQDYRDKVHSFLTENNFQCVTTNPITKDHKAIQKTLQRCDSIIEKKTIKYLVQKFPSPPTLNALLKLHKPNIPIRPVVNNKNAPGHKAAKKLNSILTNRLHRDYQHNSTK